MNKYLVTLWITFGWISSYGQINYSLEDIIQKVKAQSTRSKEAETRKENRYWQYKYYQWIVPVYVYLYLTINNEHHT